MPDRRQWCSAAGGYPIGAFGGRAEIMAMVDEQRIGGEDYVWMASTLGGNSGSVYVFSRAAFDDWPQTHKLTASDGASQDLFGYGVALDRDTAVIGISGGHTAILMENNQLIGLDVADGHQRWLLLARRHGPEVSAARSRAPPRRTDR